MLGGKDMPRTVLCVRVCMCGRDWLWRVRVYARAIAPGFGAVCLVLARVAVYRSVSVYRCLSVCCGSSLTYSRTHGVSILPLPYHFLIISYSVLGLYSCILSCLVLFCPVLLYVSCFVVLVCCITVNVLLLAVLFVY